MKLLKMRSGENQCLVYSLAMLLDVEPDVLIEELIHDGTSRWFPKQPIPYCYRGYHIQEIVDVCLARGYGLTLVELYPCLASQKDPTNYKLLWDEAFADIRFKRLLTGRKGLLIGEAPSGGGHACAWDGIIVFDPNGRKYKLDKFKIRECWLLNITSE